MTQINPMRLSFIILSFLISVNLLAQNTAAVHFTKNQGQWEQTIRYRADIPGGYLLLKEKSLRYVFIDVDAVKSRHTAKTANPATRTTDLINGHVVEVFFEGCKIPKFTENHQNELVSNYFLDNDPSHWAKNVHGFGEVIYQDIYPNIDLKLYAFRQTVKYEFIVKPTADVANIKMRYEGANSIKILQNQLQIETSVNTFKEIKPYTYQEISDQTTEVPTQFKLTGNVVSFDIQKKYNTQFPLIIDPELIFSTYSGTLADNWGHTATYDEQGNFYSAGTVHDYASSPVASRPFNVTTGAFQTRFGGQTDIGILKFSPDGSKLLWATYLGGAFTDVPHSMVVNSKNELVVMGSTSSSNFPVTTSAYQKQFAGGTSIVPISGLNLDNGSDIFIAKLNAAGNSLLASTYLGGTGNDGISRVTDFSIQNYGDEFRGEVVVDANDNIYVASSTNSVDFPLVKPTQNTVSGRQDAVVFKMDTDFKNLLFSTFLGGSGTDAAYGISLTTSGAFYVSGTTRSTNLPTKAGSFKNTLGGVEDGFVAKFSNNSLEQISYLGTDAADAGYLVDVDATDNVYVYGLTKGAYPVSVGVYSNSGSGQFVQSLDKNLSKSNFSTVFGSGRGTPDISPTAFLVNDCGNIYLSGWGGDVNTSVPHNSLSSTRNLPITADGFQKTTNGSNFWIGILEKGGKSLLYATYFGSLLPISNTNHGDHVDGGTSRFSKNGFIYQATCACGGSVSGFPTSPNAWSRTNNSVNCNNAAFKFDIDALKADFDTYEGSKKGVVSGCAPLTLDFQNISIGGKTYTWDIGGNVISRDATQSKYTFAQPGEYKVTLKAFNPLVCKGQDVVTKIIKVGVSKAKVSSDTTVCSDVPVTLKAEGGIKYVWTPAVGLSDANVANPVAKVKATTTFTVQVIDSVCTVSKTVTVKIGGIKSDFQAFKDTTICPGQSVILSSKGGIGVRWLGINTADSTKSSIAVRPLTTTTYTVEGRYADGCRPQKTVTVKVEDNKPDFKVLRDTIICDGQAVQLLAQGNAQSYKWTANSTLSDTTIRNPIARPKQTTTYSVTAKYADGCEPNRRVTVGIEKGPQSINFDINLAYNCGQPTQVQIANKTADATRYDWNLGDGKTSNINSPTVFSYSQNGTYQLVLKAYSAKGCESSVTKTLNLLNLSGLPNIITPNGDGKNDTFKIGIPNSLIEIVNPWGKLIYSSDNYPDDWGNGVTNGTYFYSLTLPNGQKCKGWIEVLQ